MILGRQRYEKMRQYANALILQKKLKEHIGTEMIYLFDF